MFAISPQQISEEISGGSAGHWKISGNSILSAIEPEYEKLISVNNQRRMCKLVKMGVYSALACVEDKDDHKLDAIIVGNGLSVFERTFDFLGSVITKEEKGLSPTPFIQSLHSTIAGQIALELQFNGYVTTYTQNAFAFENSLTDAFLFASETTAEVNVLLGALDEAPDSYQFIVEKMGRLKDINCKVECVSNNKNNGICLGEGSVFMKLSSHQKDNSLGCLKGMKTLFAPNCYSEIVSGIKELLNDFKLEEKDIENVFFGNSGDHIQDQSLKQIQSEMFIKHNKVFFKNYCGEYPTAVAYAVWMSVTMMKNDAIVKHSLIINQYQNQYYSVILLSGI